MREALRSLAGLMRRPMVAALLIGGAVFTSAWVLRGSGWLTTWELLVHDTLLRSREAPATEPVVSLVWITEHEIQEYGHPLEDRLLVRGLEAIFAHRPRVVGIDVYRDAPIGEGWEDFARVFMQHPSLVIVEKLPEGEQLGVKPPSFLTNPSQIGFSDVAPDRDGVVRRGLLYADKEGENRIAFPMMLAMHFLFAEQIAVGAAPDCPACVMLGETPIAPVEGDFGGYVGAEADGFYTPLVYRHWAGFPSATFREVVEGRA
ncbi:MAG: CHASE2 domain-containing protein, partial [Myxococcota bacterium]|nr:CHASE2 domain-containing protein [Myxococcota bacterium]